MTYKKFDPTGKVVLPDWVSIHFRQNDLDNAPTPVNTPEFDVSPMVVIPRPGEQRQPAAKATRWRGK